MFILGSGTIVSQNVFDALRYSNDEIEGSARYSAMSGAFGALGGELSAISINPAGSAIFSKGIATNTQTKNKTNFNTVSQDIFFIKDTLYFQFSKDSSLQL